jgi:type III restriction enzyme
VTVRHVNAVAGRLSLRPPQRRSLEILHRIMEMTPRGKALDVASVLDINSAASSFRSRTSSGTSPRCVSRSGPAWTRPDSWAPSSAIYIRRAASITSSCWRPTRPSSNKLIADFTPNTPKFVFRGVAEFATNTPVD